MNIDRQTDSAMSGSVVEDSLIPSSPPPSQESMESCGSTFQILSRESVDLDSNDSAAATVNNAASSDQILLTPVGETREVETQAPATPVAKPRTLLMRTIPPNSPDQAVPTGLPSTPLSRVTSSSSVERQAGETPPTPRPRPRSGEQQELRQRLNALETKVSETEGELEVANRKITHLESRNQLLEAELMAGSRGGKEDVEESLRLARRDSVKLQEAVRASEAALRDTQSRLNKSESRIAGLQEEVNVLKQPYDPRRRLEVRLSEAIGKSKELEEEVAFLREEREGQEREAREARETVEEEKSELEREMEGERERFMLQIKELMADKARLAEEKSQVEREELREATMAREGLEREVEGLKGRVRDMKTQLTEERERAREGRELVHTEFQDKLQLERRESDATKQQLATQHQEQCGSLRQECAEAEQRCANLQAQLAAANSAREAAERALKKEQSATENLREDYEKLEKTCEEYTIEINSLLRDLDERVAGIGALNEERDKLRTQVEGLRRSFAEKQEQLKSLGEELGRSQEREKRLQSQRDGLQSREEIMGLQLKQYQLDFEEERKAREEMANVMRHLEARDKDSRAQITDLQKQINTLSTEKNYLAFQLEQLRSQLQQQEQ